MGRSWTSTPPSQMVVLIPTQRSHLLGMEHATDVKTVYPYWWREIFSCCPWGDLLPNSSIFSVKQRDTMFWCKKKTIALNGCSKGQGAEAAAKRQTDGRQTGNFDWSKFDSRPIEIDFWSTSRFKSRFIIRIINRVSNPNIHQIKCIR